MTQIKLNKYQQQLIVLRDRLSRKSADLRDDAMQPTGGEASGGLSNAPIHSADMGTHEYEEEMALRLMDNTEHTLSEVNAGLERIEKGIFGQCEDCQGEIAAKRLKTLPYARRCVACEAKKESEIAG